jgi:hypothetical protein
MCNVFNTSEAGHVLNCKMDLCLQERSDGVIRVWAWLSPLFRDAWSCWRGGQGVGCTLLCILSNIGFASWNSGASGHTTRLLEGVPADPPDMFRRKTCQLKSNDFPKLAPCLGACPPPSCLRHAQRRVHRRNTAIANYVCYTGSQRVWELGNGEQQRIATEWSRNRREIVDLSKQVL